MVHVNIYEKELAETILLKENSYGCNVAKFESTEEMYNQGRWKSVPYL